MLPTDSSSQTQTGPFVTGVPATTNPEHPSGSIVQPGQSRERTAIAGGTEDVVPKSDLCRVVHVSLGTSVGGMEKLLVEFARFADRRRFTLDFVSLTPAGKFADELRAEGWQVHALNKEAGLSLSCVMQLRRLFRQLRPHVVHTHNTAAFVYGRLAAWAARVPAVIHTRHGQRFGASKRQDHLYRWLSLGVHRVVGVCEDGTQCSIEDGVSAKRTATIRNGVDLSRFPYCGPAPNGLVTAVARLSPEKDMHTLLRAFELMHTNRTISRSIELQVIGDGVQRQELQASAAAGPCSKQIHFLGERTDVARLLARASVFVLPSRTEGISLTLLEAMARGLPVVATRVGGTPEVVQQGANGLLVPAGDAVAMCKAITTFVANPQLAQAMGKAARRRVEESFSVQRMVREYESLYQEGFS